jgi:hypothetical protein
MSIVDIKERKEDQQIRDSNSYTGLLTGYCRYFYKVILTDEQYNQNGYIEKQGDKITYFKWYVYTPRNPQSQF